MLSDINIALQNVPSVISLVHADSVASSYWWWCNCGRHSLWSGTSLCSRMPSRKASVTKTQMRDRSHASTSILRVFCCRWIILRTPVLLSCIRNTVTLLLISLECFEVLFGIPNLYLDCTNNVSAIFRDFRPFHVTLASNLISDCESPKYVFMTLEWKFQVPIMTHRLIRFCFDMLYNMF